MATDSSGPGVTFTHQFRLSDGSVYNMDPPEWHQSVVTTEEFITDPPGEVWDSFRHEVTQMVKPVMQVLTPDSEQYCVAGGALRKLYNHVTSASFTSGKPYDLSGSDIDLFFCPRSGAMEVTSLDLLKPDPEPTPLLGWLQSGTEHVCREDGSQIPGNIVSMKGRGPGLGGPMWNIVRLGECWRSPTTVLQSFDFENVQVAVSLPDFTVYVSKGFLESEPRNHLSLTPAGLAEFQTAVMMSTRRRRYLTDYGYKTFSHPQLLGAMLAITHVVDCPLISDSDYFHALWMYTSPKTCVVPCMFLDLAKGHQATVFTTVAVERFDQRMVLWVMKEVFKTNPSSQSEWEDRFRQSLRRWYPMCPGLTILVRNPGGGSEWKIRSEP